MTREEYEASMAAELTRLPEDFHVFVKSWAWGEGHAHGYEKVISVANDLVFHLTPCVERFQRSCEAGRCLTQTSTKA